ncbi:YdcF family protein [Clostridiaceae bacterium 68-1-5]|uniref:YdcF family protein n=1 Tax=Suipraeoptans intestinalis TaxID=2606628 RepID=A0A6N7V267_9FIRM|nr:MULTISPECIES: YdcF family protein [Bacillota]MSR93362.1 YdcF family protein [Suipraeoptans intestinalis]
MIYWIIFGAFTAIFIGSFLREKRAFRNSIFLALSLASLFVAVAYATNGTIVNTLLNIVLYTVIPLILLFISFVFIYAGVIAIKRERFSLAHSLSIAFGVGIWGAFVAVAVTISAKNLSTITMSMVVLIALIAMYVIFTFSALFIYSQLYHLLPKNKNCDFIIVHGAGLLNGERVSPLLAGRLNKGIEVFESSGRKAKIIVSGGQGSDENISEAEAMKNYLLEKGISEHNIIMEDQSTTTLENMMFSKKIMDQMMSQYRVIFVTNDYHVFRTGTYAKQVGLKADGVGCKTAFYYWPNAFIREYIAIILKYKAVPIVLFLLWLAGTVVSMLNF